jgi:myosin heavy subunit
VLGGGGGPPQPPQPPQRVAIPAGPVIDDSGFYVRTYNNPTPTGPPPDWLFDQTGTGRGPPPLPPRAVAIKAENYDGIVNRVEDSLRIQQQFFTDRFNEMNDMFNKRGMDIGEMWTKRTEDLFDDLRRKAGDKAAEKLLKRKEKAEQRKKELEEFKQKLAGNTDTTEVSFISKKLIELEKKMDKQQQEDKTGSDIEKLETLKSKHERELISKEVENQKKELERLKKEVVETERKRDTIKKEQEDIKNKTLTLATEIKKKNEEVEKLNQLNNEYLAKNKEFQQSAELQKNMENISAYIKKLHSGYDENTKKTEEMKQAYDQAIEQKTQELSKLAEDLKQAKINTLQQAMLTNNQKQISEAQELQRYQSEQLAAIYQQLQNIAGVSRTNEQQYLAMINYKNQQYQEVQNKLQEQTTIMDQQYKLTNQLQQQAMERDRAVEEKRKNDAIQLEKERLELQRKQQEIANQQRQNDINEINRQLTATQLEAEKEKRAALEKEHNKKLQELAFTKEQIKKERAAWQSKMARDHGK